MMQALHILLPAFGAVVVLAAGAAAVCPGGSCAVPGIDAAGLALADAWRTPWLDGVARVLTWLGSLAVLLPLALLIAAVDAKTRGWRAAALLPLAVSFAGAAALLGKLLVLRPRPDLFAAPVALPTDASFPSAHALQAAAFVTVLLLTREPVPRPAWWFAGALAVTVVGLTRIYLQVHFPTDVLAGALVGVLLGVVLGAAPVWMRARP